MERIKAQGKKLWQIISQPKTYAPYKETGQVAWTILKQTGLLAWLEIARNAPRKGEISE